MQFKDEQERLVAEQAVLAYRAVRLAAKQATFGHGMEAIETAALTQGRDHIRRLIQTTANEQAASEKTTRPPAPTVADRRDPKAPPTDR